MLFYVFNYVEKAYLKHKITFNMAAT